MSDFIPAVDSGRWRIELPWQGDECDYYNPLHERTFASFEEAEDYRLARPDLAGARIVRDRPWRLPPDTEPDQTWAVIQELREAVKRRDAAALEPPTVDDYEMARRLGLRP